MKFSVFHNKIVLKTAYKSNDFGLWHNPPVEKSNKAKSVKIAVDDKEYGDEKNNFFVKNDTVVFPYILTANDLL